MQFMGNFGGCLKYAMKRVKPNKKDVFFREIMKRDFIMRSNNYA